MRKLIVSVIQNGKLHDFLVALYMCVVFVLRAVIQNSGAITITIAAQWQNCHKTYIQLDIGVTVF